MTGLRVVRAFLVFMMASLMIAPVAWMTHPTADAAAVSGVSIDLAHPTFAGKNQTVECVLTITGGPAGDTTGNFSYKAEIIGTNTTGSAVTPSSGGSPSGVFILNVTMPATAPQTIKIRINATSRESASSTLSTAESDFSMKVVDPIVIRATIYNTGAVDAKNVTAKFYADGELLETRVINVSAGSSKQIEYNWTFLSIKKGKHVITVSVNDPDKVVEFSDGNNVFSRTVYVGKQGNPTGAVLTIGIIIMSVLVGLIYISKPPPRKKKP